MLKGCFTAIVTPFTDDAVDIEGYEQLIEFQISQGITGILAAGTTGESPTLSWKEHENVIERVIEKGKGNCICIAGTGSNNTREAFSATGHAVEMGADAVLLVDPYYNGPSSLEIRREYIEPIARSFAGVQVIPYVIPGRTGAQLLPEDLALLNQSFENVSTVKEATGNLENMRRTRTCCGNAFTILSGDDGLTYEMMTDAAIAAAGVISVASNVAPGAVCEMVRLLEQGEHARARCLSSALTPLFNLVTVKTTESTPWGDVVCRARNPLAVKTLMAILGMPSGRCRKPLGKMSKSGLEIVLAAARTVQSENPEILKPVADFFGVDIDERLNTQSNWDGLCYERY